MSGEYQSADPEGMAKEFKLVRKGYDPAEVDQVLSEFEHAFRDLEEYAARLKHELNDARVEITRLEAAEAAALDNAMIAVFDTKDRIIKEAMDKARQIEGDARAAAGLPPAETYDDAASIPIDIGAELLDELKEVVASGTSGDASAESADGVQPHDVLNQMLQEAEQIRNRLDSGLSAAFTEMEKMQKDAEDRARELLASARSEAARLRETGEGSRADIAVNITEAKKERPSRYSRQSAQLPRIGGDEGTSVLAAMADLRNRSRDKEEGQPPLSAPEAAS